MGHGEFLDKVCPGWVQAKRSAGEARPGARPVVFIEEQRCLFVIDAESSCLRLS